MPTTGAPAQVSRQGQGTQTIHVSLHLDGKKIHEHLQKIDYSNAMQELRSGGAYPDLGPSRMPGLAFQN
ncbi:hypothetical protein J2D73_00020 [Acetobacter sacchari]|uniref:Peptidylprolyl isomerase n=1 Tax=Acetobacter sacchari TaxID=2661687 RepID=A0ABS3LQJ8_9PROT|nr:hypothetical protein [Acetobacter sacchari]MBO1358184.1 hypothetical protein [Acetobacter sacchari]